MCQNIQIQYDECGHVGGTKLIPCAGPKPCRSVVLVPHSIEETIEPFPDYCPDCLLGGNALDVSEDAKAHIRASERYRSFTSKNSLWLAQSMLRRAESSPVKDSKLDSFESQVNPERISNTTIKLMMYAIRLLQASFWHQVIEENTAPVSHGILLVQASNFLLAAWHLDVASELAIHERARPGRIDLLKAKLLYPSITSFAADERQCQICHDAIGAANPDGVTESLVETSCAHLFGNQCLFTWILDNESCPKCRKMLLTFDDGVKPFIEEAEKARESTSTPVWLMTFFGMTAQSLERDLVLCRSRGPEKLALSKEEFP